MRVNLNSSMLEYLELCLLKTHLHHQEMLLRALHFLKGKTTGKCNKTENI